MFGLSDCSRLGKSHVQSDASDDGLPRLVLGKAAPLDGAPEVDDLFLGYAVKKILIRSLVQRRHRVHSFHW